MSLALRVVRVRPSPSWPSFNGALGRRALVPSRTELCPQDEPMECSGTYTVTQADVDNGERSNTAKVTSTSPDAKVVWHSQEKTVLVLGSAAVSIGEALCLMNVCRAKSIVYVGSAGCSYGRPLLVWMPRPAIGGAQYLVHISRSIEFLLPRRSNEGWDLPTSLRSNSIGIPSLPRRPCVH